MNHLDYKFFLILKKMWFLYVPAMVVIVMIIVKDIWPKSKVGENISRMCLQFLKYGALAYLFFCAWLFNALWLMLILLCAVACDLRKKKRAGKRVRYEIIRFFAWGTLAMSIMTGLEICFPVR